MKLKILVYPGYSAKSYAWACPLCGFSMFPDLYKPYMKKQARLHMVKQHNAIKKLKFKYKEV